MLRSFGRGVALAAALGVACPALALDRAAVDGCQSQAANICAAGGGAQISATSGSVLLSRGAGFAELKSGTRLNPGDRVLVRSGSAQLALGPSCQTRLGANSMVTITQGEEGVCASRVSANPETVGQDLRRDRPPLAGGPLAGGVFGSPTVGIVTAVAAIGIIGGGIGYGVSVNGRVTFTPIPVVSAR